MKKNKIDSSITLADFVKNTFNTSEELPFTTTVVKYAKNKHTIVPGEVEKNLYFIRSGCVQVSVIDENGDEKILSFSFPNQFCCSLSSLITQQPTEYYLTCITPAVLELIPREQLYIAMEHSILANKIMRHFQETAYLYRLKKQKDLLTKDAKTRYAELIKEEPQIIKSLSVERIAMFLGIHPRSLSRLRKG
jgi:CRP-like cAMP-binding protein